MNAVRAGLGFGLLLLVLSATMSVAKGNRMTQSFLDALDGKVRFDSSNLSFCPQYSWFGVGKREKLGIEDLWLYYSRASPLLSPEFLTFEVSRRSEVSGKTTARTDSPLEIRESGDYGFSGVIAFAGMDIVCYHAKLDPSAGATGVKATMQISASGPKLKRRVAYNPKTRLLTVVTRMPRVDARDPDPDHPFTVCMIVPEAFTISGELMPETDGAVQIAFSAKADSMKGEQTFIVGIGEGETAGQIEARVRRLREIGSKESAAASKRWLTGALDKFSFEGIPTNLRLHYAKATYQMLSNTKAPRGRFGHPALYPARGVYATEFLWDVAFADLGVGQFNRKLAEGYLLNICENQEPDGKMPQFVCATWNRPGASEPPLIGWAAWRLYEQSGNKKLISAIYGPVGRFVDWWFEKRDQDKNGVVEYGDPLESGWDNSPRFDEGRIEGVDLNAYLNREMLILAKIAKDLGKQEEAENWNRRAGEHAERVSAVLLDPEEGVFYDRLVEQKRFRKVLTPSSFAPLWTGMPVPEKTARTMIRKYLLDPKRFFGKYPFPVVAYNDPTYNPASWWRGPVWVNIAWEMVETLDAYGYEKETREASKRLVDMMTGADELYELYSSADGKPGGCAGYSWTCGAFMDLARARFREERR